MAWGDLRFDHTDIFGTRAKDRVGMRKDAIGPGHVQWETALRLASQPGGATLADIGGELGHKRAKNNTVRLLKRMVDRGAIRRERQVTGRFGCAPFIYFKV
jgi:hypothetical protein